MKLSLVTINFIVCFFAFNAHAGLMKIGFVSAVLSSQKTAEIKIDSGVTVPAIKHVTLGDKQSNCDVKVKKQTSKIILVDITSCADNTKYAVSSNAYIYSEDYSEEEPALPSQPPLEFPKTQKSEFTNFGGGLRSANSLTFSDVVYKDGSSTATSDVKYEADSASFFLDINHINAREYSWGWMGGISYWNVKWDNVEAFNSSLTNNTTESSIINLYGSAVYRYRDVYLNFGLNFSSINTKNSPFLETAKGSIGAQLGIGFFVNSSLMLAIESKAVTYSSTYYSKGTESINADSAGIYPGLNLGLYFTLD